MDAVPKSPGRNEPCHCGSTKKYKQCCLGQDEAAAREARAKTQAAAASAPAEEATEAPAARDKRPPHVRDKLANDRSKSRGFKKTAGVRKVGGG